MQRSFAMAALATLALLTGRRALSLRAWALAAAAVLLLQPAAVLGASFQMSFAAVLALIAGWEWLRPRMPKAGRGRWRRRLALAAFGVVATSVLAGAATTPFGLHHFGRLQLYGVAANAIAVPLTSVLVMPAGMAAAALMPFGLEDLALHPDGLGRGGHPRRRPLGRRLAGRGADGAADPGLGARALRLRDALAVPVARALAAAGRAADRRRAGQRRLAAAAGYPGLGRCAADRASGRARGWRCRSCPAPPA